jgi:hypothetical protein
MSELRAQGLGPPHVRLSPRVIRYKASDIAAYEQAQTFDSNAAALEAAKLNNKTLEALEAARAESWAEKPTDRKSPGHRKKSSSRESETV